MDDSPANPCAPKKLTFSRDGNEAESQRGRRDLLCGARAMS